MIAGSAAKMKKAKRSTASRVVDPLYSDADLYLHTTAIPAASDELVASIADGIDIGNSNSSYDSAPSLPHLLFVSRQLR